MKPALQTAFRDPDGRDRGNCLSAALASVLEIDTADVPHFVQEEEDGGRYWFDAMQAWLAGRNLWMVDLPRHIVMYQLPPTAIIFATGISPRCPAGKTNHMVVYQAGKIVHDPHPDGTGLANDPQDWGFYALAKLDPAA